MVILGITISGVSNVLLSYTTTVGHRTCQLIVYIEEYVVRTHTRRYGRNSSVRVAAELGRTSRYLDVGSLTGHP